MTQITRKIPLQRISKIRSYCVLEYIIIRRGYDRWDRTMYCLYQTIGKDILDENVYYTLDTACVEVVPMTGVIWKNKLYIRRCSQISCLHSASID